MDWFDLAKDICLSGFNVDGVPHDRKSSLPVAAVGKGSGAGARAGDSAGDVERELATLSKPSCPTV